MALPTNTKQFNRLLGSTNFYRRFIQNLLDLAAPLQELTRDEVDVLAGLDFLACSSTFQILLRTVSTALFLLNFDFFKKQVLQVDCSGFALSAILSEPDDTGARRLVSFLSQKLIPSQLVWQVHDQ